MLAGQEKGASGHFLEGAPRTPSGRGATLDGGGTDSGRAVILKSVRIRSPDTSGDVCSRLIMLAAVGRCDENGVLWVGAGCRGESG